MRVERSWRCTAEKAWVRFRTIGDMTCTGATESRARALEDIVNGLVATTAKRSSLLGHAA